MSDPRKIKEVQEEEIPEVIAFLDAQTRLEEFKAHHPKLMKEFEALIDEYNTAREAADTAVRAKGVDCGPWKQLSPSIKYDAEKLFTAVGREDFVRLGGLVRTVNEYAIDKVRLEAAIAAGKVPAELVELVREVSRKYHSIPKAVLP